MIQAELTRLGNVGTARGDTDLMNFTADAINAKLAIHDHKDISATLATLKRITDSTSSTEKAAMAALIGPADRSFVVEGAIWSSLVAVFATGVVAGRRHRQVGRVLGSGQSAAAGEQGAEALAVAAAHIGVGVVEDELVAVVADDQ